ncbi:alpha/beta hydrolase [Roseiconus nitratireducens]|uniref:Alpha/beta hydrolase n=2 Tax=Roseiconus nitratireducens TaxID=2605748 RepID=A0A5M6DAX3_9BACT|nr:alpha/beta hydrolase [Roseiconus nitratireducens]
MVAVLASHPVASAQSPSAAAPGSEQAIPAPAADVDEHGYRLIRDLPYTPADAEPESSPPERCRVDLYYPAGRNGFATVVWFHGGGLKSGKKSIPDGLKNRGVAVVAANYRLHPNVSSPTYVQDAAAAVAWTFDQIEKYGGDPDQVFVAGHSAGGYLTSMIGLDPSYLAAHGIQANRIAGLIPYSGHTITHFTVRAERGISKEQPIVDSMAPLYHVRSDAPPILLVTGDREMEMVGRYEENAYFWRMLKVVGHPDVTLYELDGYDHGGMADPAHALTLKFIRRIVAAR